jgi:hypothetical protein
LGLMLTLRLEFCPVCDVWIRFKNDAIYMKNSV